MKLTLVQPPSNYVETFLLSPPLGLLSIAAAAEAEGIEASLIDFNLKGLQDKRWQTADYFYPNALEQIQEEKPNIVGFTSMGIESHVCLELAKQLKDSDQTITTVLGGPHFGAIATEVLQHYPWIDYVIAGEGEVPLQNLLRLLQHRDLSITMDNIAYRSDKGIQFTRRGMSGRDLDELPFPAYHLVNMEEYFELNPSRLACFEHARGCYLKCSFCYSPQHWGHGESRKSISRIIDELEQLKSMGIKELFWVSDNLLNSKTHAIEVSQAIQEAELEFKWHCYGTLPQITPPVVESLSRAGCQSIFVGVDAVADDAKKRYQKSYFKSWEKLHSILMLCLSKGITPTCAFMLSPHDSQDTLEDTLRVAGMCALLGCFVRLNALTNYNGTQIEVSDELQMPDEYSEAYSTVLFDTAKLLITNPFAKKRPHLFPFHRCFAIKEVHEFFAGFCRLAMRLINTHKALVSIGPQEHDISLFETIGNIRMQFDLDDIDCRKIGSEKTNTVFYLGLMQQAAKSELPGDLIKLDRLMQGPNIKQDNQVANFQVNDIYVTCQCPKFVIVKSKLDLQNGLLTQCVRYNYYFAAVVNGKLMMISILGKQSSRTPSGTENQGYRLELPDYIRLVQNRILVPLVS